MTLIQITEFEAGLSNAETTFEKYYAKKPGFYIVQRVYTSGNYSKYAIARRAAEGEDVPPTHMLSMDFYSANTIRQKIVRYSSPQ